MSAVSQTVTKLFGKEQRLHVDHRLAAATAGAGQFAIQMMRFQLIEDLPGPIEHLGRHAGQAGDVDAVALVGAAGGDLVQEDNLLVPFAHQHVVIAQARQRLRELGQFVIMRGEQGPAADADCADIR